MTQVNIIVTSPAPVLASCVLAFGLALTTLGVRSAAAADDPARLYQEFCAVCHGEKGDGQSRARQGLVTSPRDFTTPGLATTLPRASMLDAVLNGRPGTAMVAWRDRLSPAQAAAIVDYIRAAFMRPAASAGGGRGAQIYTATCSVCHGEEGGGALWASTALQPPPRNFRHARLARKRMLRAVRHGRPGTAMPAFGTQLSEADITAVVDYIRASLMPEGMAEEAEPQPLRHQHDHSAPDDVLPGGLIGNAAAGKALYDANCVACHGERGDGEGPRAYFIFPRPRNFLTEVSHHILNRPELFNAIKRGIVGREMPAWGKVLSDQQIADIAEYVYGTFVHPTAARAGSHR